MKKTGLLLRAALFVNTAAIAQQPLNLDFEKLSVEGVNRPWGWSQYSYAAGAAAIPDSIIKRNGKYSYKITGSDTISSSSFAMGYWIAPQSLRGQKIKITGWYKTATLDGRARIAAESYGAMGTLTTLDSASKIITGTGNSLTWTKFELNTSVDTKAVSTYLILELTGRGTIWFDDISFALNGLKAGAVRVAPGISTSQLNSLRRYIFPVHTLDATQPGVAEDFSDLEAFRTIAGDARVIAIGESSHGTSEFFRMKNRLLEYAVKKMGVSVFTIEANQLACERINNYVCKGIGTPEKLIRSLFAVWNTEEVLNLIKWMREYNSINPQNKVEFAGIDMQDPFLPMDSLSAFLGRYNPALQRQTDSLLSDYKAAWKKQYYPTADDNTLASWKNNASQVWNIVSAEKENWLRAANSKIEKEQVEWAIQNAKIIYQNATLRSYLNNSLNSIYRDSCMGENLKWSLDRRGKTVRTILWAHDAHISRCADPDPSHNYFSGESMGSFLVSMYGNNYRAFGLSTYEGTYSGTLSFSDFHIQTSMLFPSPAGSLDEALHRIARQQKQRALLLDLRPARSGPALQWLLSPGPIRFIGYASEDYTYAQLVSIPYQFDAIIFIDQTTHSKLLK